MACGGGYDYKLVDVAGKDMYCAICTSFVKRVAMFQCGHVFCNFCIVDFMQSSIQRNVKIRCPVRCDKDIYPVLQNSIEEHLKLSNNDHLLLVAANSQKTKAEILQSEQLQQQKVNELQQEINLLKESNRLQQQQMEEQQKKMDLSEEGEKLRQQQMNEQSQEIKILKEKFEEQELKITKLRKKDEDQRKEIYLLKKKGKNQQTEIQELKETVKKNQDNLQPSPEIQKHLKEISKEGLDYIEQLLSNKNTLLSTIQQLLHNLHIIDMKNVRNETIFHLAAWFNRADVLELLLSVDTSHIDDVNDDSDTALMFAVDWNHIECVHVLLTSNADVNIKDRFGRTPLSWAHKKKYVDIIRLLEKH